MGDTKTSNGVSKNSNAKKKSELSVQRDADIRQDISKFTGDPDMTINANCTMWEVKQRENDKDTNSNASGNNDETATTANTTIEAENPITQTLANVELAGVYVKVYEVEKEKDEKGNTKKSAKKGRESEQDIEETEK